MASKNHRQGFEWVAYHEAGHAVAKHHFGEPIKSVRLNFNWIDDPDDSVGVITPDENKDQSDDQLRDQELSPENLQSKLENSAVIALAGLVAEHILDGSPENLQIAGGGKDLEDIQKLFLEVINCDFTFQQIVVLYSPPTMELLKEKWQAVQALARVLMDSEFLSGDEIVRVIETNL
jgi:ATP-dependent Zn protease